MQSQDDLMHSFIVTTKFYDHLRGRLNGYLSTREVKELVKDIYTIIRYKSEKVICKFDQLTTLIIIYGQLKYNDHVYRKSEFFTIHNIDDNIEILYSKPSTLILLNAQVLDLRVAEIVNIRERIKILQRCMPVQQLKLNLNQTRNIAKLIQIRIVRNKYTKLESQPGIYLFYQGVFQLCNQNIPVLQLENNFIQISQKLEFTVRLKDSQGKYGFINREAMYQLLDPQAIIQLQKLWRLKQQIKVSFQAKHSYIAAAQKLRQKINKKFKLAKKINEQEKEKFEMNKSQSLAASRKTMLQKCSTVTMLNTPNKSRLSSPQKTSRSSNVSKSAISFNTFSWGEKHSQSLGLTEERLQRMRKIEGRKKKTQLQKQWYHLDPQKSNLFLKETYWKIKKVENPRQAKALCNYKRVYRIYSDPCFRKPFNFRNL